MHSYDQECKYEDLRFALTVAKTILKISDDKKKRDTYEKYLQVIIRGRARHELFRKEMRKAERLSRASRVGGERACLGCL